MKRLDLGGDVAARQQESHHAPRPAVLPGGQSEVGEGDQEEPSGGQEEEDGGGGGGSGGTDEGGSTPHPRGVAPPSGVGGVSAFIKSSTAAPASSVLLFLSLARLLPISFPNLCLSAWQYRGSRRVATLSSTSRHVSAEIQAFCLASCGAVFGTALRRAAKSVSVRNGAAGGGTGHRLRPPIYRRVVARGAPGKHPRTMR